MHGTIDGFNYGAVTPVVAYVMACLGSALGLRCTIRSLRTDTSWKPAGWGSARRPSARASGRCTSSP